MTQTPVAASMPVAIPAEDEMPNLEEADSKEPSGNLRGSPEGPTASAPKVMLIRGLMSDYSDIPLVGFSQPELYQVMPWLCFEAENMCEPPWCMALALIWWDEVVRYVAAMFTWFCHWRASRGSWPHLPQGELDLDQEMKEEINWCFARALRYNILMIGEMQALKMLITLQCLTEAGPQRPAPGYVCQCIESIIRPMVAMGIGFTAHTVMASIPSGRSIHSTSWETDVLTVDISSLPSSIGSAEDLAKWTSIEAAMDVSITVPTDTSSEVATEGTVTDQKERNDA